jgi:hypothetical protein
MASGWQAAAYPDLLARRRQRQQDVAWPESTALRAVRAEVLSRFSNVISREILALVDEHVQIPLAASDSSDQKSFPVARSTIRRSPRFSRDGPRVPSSGE